MTSERNDGLPWWIKLVGSVAALMLLTIGLFYFLGHAGTGKWKRYGETLRAGGMPLTFDDIAAQQAEVPDGPNVADTILGIADALNGLGTERSDDNVWIFDRSVSTVDAFTDIPQYTIEPTRGFLADHVEVLDALAAFRELPAGHFVMPRDSNAAYFQLPEFSLVRKADKLLRVDGLMQLVDKDLAGAVETVRLQRRISEALDQHPTIIGRLVQIAGDALIAAAIEDILKAESPDLEAIEAMEQDLDNRLAAATMKWGMLGERAFIVAVFDDMAAGNTQSPAYIQVNTGVPPWIPVWLVRQNQMRAAEMLTWLVDAGDDPAALMKAANRIDREMPTAPASHFLVKMMMPSLSRACVLHLRCRARLSAARVALAAERFRIANGRFPASLDELVPSLLHEVPLDPFDGKPLRLATTDEGIVIYSVDFNGVDDGGDLQRAKKTHDPPDTGCRLVMPEHRGIVLIDTPPPDDD